MINDNKNDTSGFYNFQEPNILSWGANLISGPNFILDRSKKDSYQYPINGWYWFDSEEDAKKFFNISENPQENLSNQI